MKVGYFRGVLDTKEIKTVCESIDKKGLSLSSPTGYYMIRFCPQLLKTVYPIYQSLKTAICKAFRR